VNLDPRPPVPPQRLAWTALAACLAATFLGFVIIRINPAVGLWFNEVFCILAVAWAVTRWSGRAPAAYVGLRWPGFPAVLFAAGLSVANYVGLAGPINAVSEHFAPESLRDALDITRILDQLTISEVWLFGSAAVLAAPFCEEFLFRGVVQQGLSRGSGRPLEAVFLSGLVFALFHLNPVSFLALLELGIFFGLLYQRTGSLVPGIVAHATQNATTLGIYSAFQAGRPESPDVSGELEASKIVGLAGMGIVVLLALLFLVARRFPSVWGRPPAGSPERPRVSLGRALAPWLIAASIWLLGWYAVDRRGVELGVADWQVEVPPSRQDEPASIGNARAELETLRKHVHAGQAPLHQYLESRRALAESLEEKHPPQSPTQPR
jgi:membrane protease YdiL (CAAX protease family)